MSAEVKKSIRVITPEQVDAVFSDDCIAELEGMARLPPNADHERFANGVRAAARGYARDVRTPNLSEQRAEIKALYGAASRREHERVARLIASMSPQVRTLLSKRGARRTPVANMPAGSALLDECMREAACETLASLCRLGGAYGAGRKRKTGKRSRGWHIELYAPSTCKHPPKREAERTFTRNLQLTWLEATGKEPSTTARADSLGPFARFVRQSFALVGAASTDASVVEYIEEVNLRRWEVKHGKRHPRREQKREWRQKRRGLRAK